MSKSPVARGRGLLAWHALGAEVRLYGLHVALDVSELPELRDFIQVCTLATSDGHPETGLCQVLTAPKPLEPTMTIQGLHEPIAAHITWHSPRRTRVAAVVRRMAASPLASWVR